MSHTLAARWPHVESSGPGGALAGRPLERATWAHGEATFSQGLTHLELVCYGGPTMEHLPQPTCDRPQCQSTDVRQLHNGYVAHRSSGEEACPRSMEGHRRYVQGRRTTGATY